MARVDVGELQVGLRADTLQYDRSMLTVTDSLRAAALAGREVAAAVQQTDRAIAGAGRGAQQASQSYELVSESLRRAQRTAQDFSRDASTAFNAVFAGVVELARDADGPFEQFVSGGALLGRSLDAIGNATRGIAIERLNEGMETLATNAGELGMNLIPLAGDLNNIFVGTGFRDQFGDLAQDGVQQLQEIEAVIRRINRLAAAGRTIFPDVAPGAENLLATLTANFDVLGREAFVFQDALNQILTTTPPGETVLEQELLRLQQVNGLARQVEATIDGIVEGTRRSQTLLAAGQLFPDAIPGADRIVRTLQDNFGLLGDEVFAFRDTLSSILTEQPPGETVFQRELLRLRAMDQLMQQVADRIAFLEEAQIVPDPEPVRNFLELLTRIDGRLAGLAQPTQDVADRLRTASEAAAALDAALTSPEGLRDIGEQLEDANRAVADMRSQFERLLSGALTPLGLEFERQGGILERLTPEFERIGTSVRPLSETEEQAEELSAAMEALARVGNQTGRALGRAFADALIRARDLGGVLNALLATLVQAAATEFIGNPISRLFGSFAGGRQFGGRVAAGQTVLVGEAGPETFTPDTAGVVTPGVPGGSVVINVNGVNAPELVEAAVQRALLAQTPGVVAETVDDNRFRRRL